MTPEMEKRIIDMAIVTWDAIGGDCLDAYGKRGTLKRAEVVEIVQDAGYMQMYGEDPEAYEAWKKLSHEEQDRIVQKAFPSKLYTR